jgi:hypothetical protein
MKSSYVLLLSIVLTVSLGTLIKNVKIVKKSNLVSPLVAGANTSLTEEDLYVTPEVSIFDWPVFTNNFYGYRIKHPSNVIIKNNKDGDIAFQKSKSVNILITQEVLGENENVNTVMENIINVKKNRLKESFSLINSISPIAMSSATAQTYTSEENGQRITYYFIPQKDKKYLVITNSSLQNGGVDYLLSEDIVYSIQLIP